MLILVVSLIRFVYLLSGIDRGIVFRNIAGIILFVSVHRKLQLLSLDVSVNRGELER